MLPFLYSPINTTDTYPEVYGAYPSAGASGGTTAIGIRCTNLPPVGTGTVTATVSGATATVTSWDPITNTVYVTVPAGVSDGDIIVTVNGVKSTCGIGLWNANPVPTVSALAPFFGLPAGGQTIIIDGTGFNNGTATVEFGSGSGNFGTSVVVLSATQLTVVAPACTPTPTGNTPIDVIVHMSGSGASVPTFASKYGVLPTNTQWAFNVASDIYTFNSGTNRWQLADISGTTIALSAVGIKPPLTTLNGAPAITVDRNGVPGTSLAVNARPPIVNAPYSFFQVCSVPAWNGAHWGQMGAGTATAGWQLIGTTIFYLDSTGTSGFHSTTALNTTGLPGNLLIFSVNGASSEIIIDGVTQTTTVVGTPAGSFQGISFAINGGFPGTITSTLEGILSGNSAADFAAIRSLSQFFYLTS